MEKCRINIYVDSGWISMERNPTIRWRNTSILILLIQAVRMIRIITVTFICTFLFACSDDQDQPDTLPDNVEIDVNKDGDIDFEIVYSKQIEGFPVEPVGLLEVVRGKILSFNQNQLLFEEDKTLLFLNDVSTIKQTVVFPISWVEFTNENTRNTIVTIRQNFDGESWQTEWRVVNEQEQETYLVGFKLFNKSVPQIGFIEMAIDDKTGEVEVVNTEFL